MKKLILTALCILPLTSCMSREDADARLLKGCEAAVAFFLHDGYTVKKIKRTTFKPSTEFGNGYREVMIYTKISDGWHDKDEEYKCVFAENFNAMESSHQTTLYQVSNSDKALGMKNGTLHGDSETLKNLESAVNNAMR
jgi:hypothetical protein